MSDSASGRVIDPVDPFAHARRLEANGEPAPGDRHTTQLLCAAMTAVLAANPDATPEEVASRVLDVVEAVDREAVRRHFYGTHYVWGPPR